MNESGPARSNLTPPRRYDDPSTKIWSLYLEQAEKDNARMTESWKADMDAILIFAGLFSASVTAFIVESYRNLMPDNTDTTVILLAQIYRQLSNDTGLDSTLPSVFNVLDTNAFVPSTSSLICNILWFLSLSLSLTAALSATLVQQWSRNYLQATVGRDIPYQRARISTYLYEGLTRFHMKSIVNTIPMLLHTSLLLFFAGLVLFLQPVNAGISQLILCLLVMTAVLYILISILPIFHFDCPYESPLTRIWWRIIRSAQLIFMRDSQSSPGSSVPVGKSLQKVREWEATKISYERDERDFRAICWTLEYSPDDSSLELFASIIPDVVAGIDYSAKLLCHRLLNREDSSMRLGFRLTRLLATCTSNTPWFKRRCIVTLSAIWSLTMMALPMPNTPYGQTQVQPYMNRGMLRFDEHTLRYIEVIQSSIPGISSHFLSTATVIARSLLDMFSDHVLYLETELLNYTRTGTLPIRYQELVTKARNNTLRQGDPLLKLDRIDREAWDIHQKLNAEQSVLSASTYVSLDSLLRHINDFLVTALIDDEEEIALHVHAALTRLEDFQALLRQTSFLLILEYIESMLKSTALPHEAFNTTRRLYLRLDLESHRDSYSVQSQTRLVCCLEQALLNPNQDSSRLPEGIVNMLLGLIRAVTDPGCVSRVKGIVSAYTRVCVSSSNLEAAREAVEILDLVLPDYIRPPEALDIFSEHLYAQPQLTRTATLTTIDMSSKE
ncbi:hypothetical protein EV360DRAFT_79549 [Lentinula raphanica]|nr:hypothetical protein EV360DRAFT_79549 [Lentinula raphanica]